MATQLHPLSSQEEEGGNDNIKADYAYKPLHPLSSQEEEGLCRHRCFIRWKKQKRVTVTTLLDQLGK